MPSRFLSLIAGLLAAPAAFAQAPAHKIEFTNKQAITASIAYDLRTTDFAVSRWMVYMSEPPELPSQTKLKVASEPAGKVIAEKSPIARKVRLFDVPVAQPVAGSRLVLKQDIQAVLRSRKLVALAPDEKPPAVPALSAAEKRYYLASSPHVDFDRRSFKDWLDEKKLHRGKGEPPLDYARRVLEFIRSGYEYNYDPREEKRASLSCSRASTDCGGMSLVFVGAMRAHDIPARLLVGRLALPRKAGTSPRDTEYDQPHVRAEFHVPGIGWIPVEPSFANRSKNLPIGNFLGNDPGDLLVLHVDLDLRLPISDQEQNADILQVEPFVWTVGRGKLDLTLGPTKWDLKSVPIGK